MDTDINELFLAFTKIVVPVVFLVPSIINLTHKVLTLKNLHIFFGLFWVYYFIQFIALIRVMHNYDVASQVMFVIAIMAGTFLLRSVVIWIIEGQKQVILEEAKKQRFTVKQIGDDGQIVED